MFLDVWINNENDVKNLDQFLKLLNSKVLYQKDNFGDILIKNVHDYFEKGPDKLSESERELRINWCLKTFERIKNNDIEGNFRKLWLAHDLLQIYFELRNIWYLGPKYSFKWLKENDPEMYILFENLYKSNGLEKNLKNTLIKVLGNELKNKNYFGIL